MAVPVKFRYGLYSEYKGLNSHESGTLYFITDRGLIFRGDSLVTQKIDVSTNVDSSNNTYLIITDNEGWENVNTYEVYDRQAILNILQTYMTAADAMHFKGILGTGTGQVSLPTYGYKAGDVYKVGEAGTYAGQYCEVGDMVIAIKDGPASGSVVTASDWTVVQENIDGAVTVPQHDYVLDSSNVIVGNGGRTVRKVPHGQKPGEVLVLDSSLNPSWRGLSLDDLSGILSVPYGGTGRGAFPAPDASTDSSGFALIGNGIDPLLTRKIINSLDGNEETDYLVTAAAIAAAINDAIADASASAVINWLPMA